MLVGNFWSVGKSIVNKFTDGFTDGTCMQKKKSKDKVIGIKLFANEIIKWL
jgi:hypothetical protein